MCVCVRMHMHAHSDFNLLLRFPFFGISSARSVLWNFEALLRNKSVFVDNSARVVSLSITMPHIFDKDDNVFA